MDLDKKNYAVFDNRETVVESIIKDFFSFGFLAFCIYISHGSRWWTFFMGVIAIIAVSSKVTGIVKQRYHKFHSKAELKKWVDALDEF